MSAEATCIEQPSSDPKGDNIDIAETLQPRVVRTLRRDGYLRQALDRTIHQTDVLEQLALKQPVGKNGEGIPPRQWESLLAILEAYRDGELDMSLPDILSGALKTQEKTGSPVGSIITGIYARLALDSIQEHRARSVQIQTSPKFLPRLLPVDTPKPLLLPDEQELLPGLARGLSHSDVGKEFGITAQTVAVRVDSALFRLNARTSLGALLKCVDLGLLNLGDVTPGFDLQKWQGVSADALNLLQTINDNPDCNSNQELAELAGWSFMKVPRVLTETYRQLEISPHANGINRRVPTILMYRRYMATMQEFSNTSSAKAGSLA